jgi:cystathionine beta-lyase
MNTSYFDALVERKNTNSLKWDRYADSDIIPLWVADMDFRSPPQVIAALQERVSHGVFGYTLAPKELSAAVIKDIATSFGWEIQPEWIVYLPGLVSGLNIAARAVGAPGDDQITFTPIYPPFFSAPRNAERNLVQVPLLNSENAWSIDFDALQNAITPNTSLLMLCNPHNPVGRVFTVAELKRLAKICLAHNITICSDEIHNGLILDKQLRHIPIAALASAIAQKTITLMAPSKTYNIPGLACSFAIIPNPDLRRSFHKVMDGIVPHVNLLGYTAALACYRESKEWHTELLDYLRGNRDLVEQFLQTIPELSVAHCEATYLAWIDARKLGVADPAKIFANGGVGLSDGTEFGLPGFVRLNFGCRRALLLQALERVQQVCKTLRTS